MAHHASVSKVGNCPLKSLMLVVMPQPILKFSVATSFSVVPTFVIWFKVEFPSVKLMHKNDYSWQHFSSPQSKTSGRFLPLVIMIRVKDELRFFFFFFAHFGAPWGCGHDLIHIWTRLAEHFQSPRPEEDQAVCWWETAGWWFRVAGGWKEDEEQQQQQDASIFLIDDRVANSIIISSLPFTHWRRDGIGNITLLTCGSLTLIPCHKH